MIDLIYCTIFCSILYINNIEFNYIIIIYNNLYYFNLAITYF